MNAVSIFLLSLAVSQAAFGQQHTDVRLTDTANVPRVVIIDPGISLGKPTILLPPSLLKDSMLVVPFSLFLREYPGGPPPFLAGAFEERIDLTAPLRLQMEREERLRPLQTILGTVQIGGVAYIAYRHIKKYGLFK